MRPQIVFKEKSVIIHRDENGFGLRVGGQNPVFVDCVHENGAAWKAGVRKNDRIIKVNGTLVRSYNHQLVVHMIQNCTPFVNLTLHSPETQTTTPTPAITNDSSYLAAGCCPSAIANNSLQSNEQQQQLNDSNIGGTSLNISSGSCNMVVSNNNNNSLNNNNLMPKIQSRIQRLHPHSVPNNLNWLLDIGDDLFQDNSQQNQHANLDLATSAVQQQQPSVGVSKLIVSGPNPIVSRSDTSASSRSKLRHTRYQASTRDNPYYYYKTGSDNKVSDLSSSSTAATSMVMNSQDSQRASSKLSSVGSSIVRSRSSSKMSTRSTKSGKYKTARNLRSRLVEDLKSLSIVNSQVTPSSLSTSPSSSDLSDCDDQDTGRLDCLTNLNTSNSSGAGAMLNSSSGNNLQSCMPKSKQTTRRLEIIRELVDTEKTHTERLKHLNDLLYKPIKVEGLVPQEQLKMVFSCHKTLFKIHRQIYKILSAAQQNTMGLNQEPLIGRALIEIFEGDLGKRLEKAASTFCACQSTNTELLNRFTRKDTKAGEFLAQVANQQMLGRLGIKDLLASCFQRLTKYPLLLENLLKATPTLNSCGIHSKSLSEGSISMCLAAKSHIQQSILAQTSPSTIRAKTMNDGDTNQEMSNSADLNGDDEISEQAANQTIAAETETSPTVNLDDEYAYERLCISRALNQSRQILVHVNDAVTRAVAQSKLKDIWKKTDKHVALPAIDIETQQLLHDGNLTLRLAKRTFEVFVMLLTQYLIILTREGQDRYKLKNFNADGNQFSPIFNIDEHLATRDTATDENGFYLLCKRKDDSRIYEFASQSPTERAKWKEKIHSAQQFINSASVPDDDNTLTRYRELISLATSSNTPNNIEHSSTNNNIVATLKPSTNTISSSESAGLTQDNNSNSHHRHLILHLHHQHDEIETKTTNMVTSTTTPTTTTTSGVLEHEAPVKGNNSASHDLEGAISNSMVQTRASNNNNNNNITTGANTQDIKND